MKSFILCIMCAIITSCAKRQEAAATTESKALVYKEDWASLGEHNEAPQWFKDAKFGIYFHWGLYSVPAFKTEWYPRWMHFEGHEINKYHVETYGPLSEFGYHDFAPLFTAEKFNAEEWAQLFKDAGARFAGPVAEHHDGYSMWDSDITPWNTMDTGPHRDITGELEKAIKGKGMRFITTFHHAKNLQRSTKLGTQLALSHYPYLENIPPSSEDPDLKLLYGNVPAEQWYSEIWLGKLKEVSQKYHPDIVWFDYVLGDIPEQYRREFVAFFLNEAQKQNQEVVLIRKQHDLPSSVSLEDLEQSRKNEIGTKPWMTDATISDGSWSYTENLGVKQAVDILHMLIDIVSKNGVLLLNVSPRADGTIPNNQKEAILQIGAWLKKYGEAIYDTEAWYTFGEGPTKEPKGHFENHDAFMKLKYSNKDIRYTIKDYTIYAMFLGAPEPASELVLTAFAKENILDPVQIESVVFMGTSQTAKWNYDANLGLVIETPKQSLDPLATVLKIQISQ
ncbi:MAG: hypothetical protein RLZZ241_944 [Bacteroidota bacterium]|jgi:alpha-L-fucosidase